MNVSRATVVVVLTPPGRGAVASLLVAGPRAVDVVGCKFHGRDPKSLAEQPPDKVLYGRWLSAVDGEEVVVCRRDADSIEIHCHGGRAASAAIVSSLEDDGCQSITWQDWLRDRESDPLTAAARIALAWAPTERAAAVLWDQASGALRQAIDRLAAAIASGDCAGALGKVDVLLEFSGVGTHLVTPWKVVFAGPPNVGKSSLVNAVLGYQRSIVDPTPGTTRDVVTATTALDGWPVELADTAGLHASNDPLETAGMQLSRVRLESADLVVVVHDASRPQLPLTSLQLPSGAKTLHVWNKCDLLDALSLAGLPVGPLQTSATQGAGIESLVREIAVGLAPRAPQAGQAVPFEPAHIAALEQVRQLLSVGQLAAAGDLVARPKTWTASSAASTPA